MQGLLIYRMGLLQPNPPRSSPPSVDAYQPYSEPLFSYHHEQDVLGNSSLIGVLDLDMGDFHLPYTLQDFHVPFQHFISPLLSFETSQPTSYNSTGHPITNL